ncbi:MAG: hypothetical protein ABI222_12595 [Opitutaceae bacterium]
MKSLLRPDRLALFLALIGASSLGAALTPTEWSHRQLLHVTEPGLVRVELTPATFDSASPQQADLRVIDAHGLEIASLLGEAPLPGNLTAAPTSFEVKLVAGTTVITLATPDKTRPLESVSLSTPHPYFLRAARVEVSNDGVKWTLLDEGLPLFRQWGAEKLDLPLTGHSAGFVRVVVTDGQAQAIPFTTGYLHYQSSSPSPLIPVGAQITRRDEFAGETVLTLTLDGSHLPLAALEFETNEPLFMRRVAVTIREVRDGVSGERTEGSGTIYRVALNGAPPRTQLTVPLSFLAAPREVLVHIYNGDSPPLALTGVKAQRRSVDLEFVAATAGDYFLLTGNPQATAPQYDLAGFSSQMREARATSVVPGDLEPMPNYQARESLPDVPLAGAPLDATEWTEHRAILMQRPGVQELELDLEALARSRPDFGDLRILRAGNQIPYVLEQPALARSVALVPTATPDAKRPSVSVWQLHLPQAGAPIRRLVLTSSNPLFSREFRVYEKINPADGQSYENLLASGSWSRKPEPGTTDKRIFEMTGRPQTDILWIETDNGDNPAITLGTVQAVYPVVRLVYKVEETDGTALIYGRRSANPPRYDLSLVAGKLLTASRNVATLSAGDPNSAPRSAFAGLKGGYIFWGVLGLVVIVLLAVVAKLLPKPPTT